MIIERAENESVLKGMIANFDKSVNCKHNEEIDRQIELAVEYINTQLLK